MLDPEQNSTFVDHYLGVPFDLSQVCCQKTSESILTTGSLHCNCQRSEDSFQVFFLLLIRCLLVFLKASEGPNGNYTHRWLQSGGQAAHSQEVSQI